MGDMEQKKFNPNAYKQAFRAQTYDRLEIFVAKGKKQRVKILAARRGFSLNGFVTKLIDDALAQAKEKV